MQKRAISDNITIDYAPFDSFFREDGGRVHHGYHCPPMHPIRDLHHPGKEKQEDYSSNQQ